jgi:hypothetical protein
VVVSTNTESCNTHFDFLIMESHISSGKKLFIICGS